MNFKGFSDWIEIFRGGRQVDSLGREHDGDELIEKAVANFDAAKHEPPVVIGHPADNAPAFGWVEGLKQEVRDGVKVLLAKFSQVQPEFEEMVKRGLFKKRSAAFYPDGTLRHVGFLGAAPPAVKGLTDLSFAAPAAAVFEFAEAEDGRWASLSDVFRRLRELLIEKFGQDTADRVLPNWFIEEIRPAPVGSATEALQTYQGKEETMNIKEFVQRLKDLISGVEKEVAEGPAGKTFSEADIERAKREAAEAAAKAEREKMAAAFAEQTQKTRQDALRREISSWCDSMIAQGKMTPAMVKFGLDQILFALATNGEVIEFGETKEKATLYDRFKAFFEKELPKVVEFKEIATRGKDTDGQGAAGAKIEALVAEKLKANKELTYSAAFAEVQREHPDLAREYHQEIGG